MKRILVVLMACFLSAGAQAQTQPGQGGVNAALDAAAMDAVKKDKDKSDKDITDAKASGKASTWMDRAKTYQGIAAQYIRIDSAAATTAQEAYNKVIELDKDKKGGPGRLAKEAQEALKSQQMYSAFMQQGVAKFQGKNYPDAIKAMMIAGDINPKDTTAPLYTAIAAQQVKDNATAKTQLEKYITAGGRDPQIYGSLAMLYRADNDVDKALAALDKGIALSPANKDLSSERVNIMLASNRMDDAIVGMKQLVEKDPNNAQNLVNLSIVYHNSAEKINDEYKKLNDQAGKGSNTGKQLTDAKGILDTYNSEVTRLSGLIKKQPKNAAELKRQLTDVQKKSADQKATVAKLEADAKDAASNASGASDAAKGLPEMKQKLDEQRTLEKEYLSKALAVDQNNFDANYNLGVYYYNEAVEMKRTVDRMDMSEYNKRGKEVDGQVCGKFKQALPYFLKAKGVKEEAELTENLTNLQNILKQYEERKVACIEAK